jgi:hypothetical protein
MVGRLHSALTWLALHSFGLGARNVLPPILLAVALACTASANPPPPPVPGTATPVKSAEELTAALQAGAKHIVITADLNLSQGTGLQSAIPVAANTLSIRVCALWLDVMQQHGLVCFCAHANEPFIFVLHTGLHQHGGEGEGGIAKQL